MEEIVIEKLKDSEIEKVALMLALAFQENPNSIAVFENPKEEKSKKAAAEIFKSAKLKRKYSNVYVAKLNGEIVGAINYTLWPKCQPSALEQLTMLPKMLKHLGKNFGKAGKIFGTWGKHDPKKPHIHIGPLGVHPDFKGNEIGSSLIKHVLEIADKSNTPCYLETDAAINLPLYKRHGFKITKEVPILNYPTWLMWRDNIIN